ncbi:MAG: hypothetical protein CMJ72_12880 [Planctomycetaceae bacterium]|nr:hypothetical protein [Planctomycetaceae bacterium]
MSTRIQVAMLLSSWIFLGVDASPLQAQQLRIETDVFEGDEQESKNHNVTLFDAGTVYDFIDNPSRITIFRPPTHSRPGKFILLDLETQQRTEVSTDRIEGLMKKLSRWATEHQDPVLQFAAEPQFEESYDQNSGALTLKHPMWGYVVATIPAENKESLASYREFTDWYSRLTTMLYGNLPPGPRLELNAALEKHGVVPVEIRRTVESASTQLRATHLFSWRLSREDLTRLEEAREHLARFEKVANKEFLAQRAEQNIVRGQSE